MRSAKPGVSFSTVPAQYMEVLGTTSTKVFPMNPGDKLEF